MLNLVELIALIPTHTVVVRVNFSHLFDLSVHSSCINLIIE